MGIILTRFRKKLTTLEVLEDLEKDINHIEAFSVSTEQRHRTIVGHLVLYSVGVYVLTAVLFYFYYFPASLNDQLIYITPLLIFPVIIVLVKRLVSWYYHRKISRNQEKLLKMRKEKKQLLEEVMDKETYKVAKQILEKFAPDQLRKTPALMSTIARPGMELPSPHLQVRPLMSPPVSPGTELRRRAPPPGVLSQSPVESSPPGVRQQSNGQQGLPPRPVGPPLPRPILPRERSVLDRLVEYLVGDGPSTRYALVCRQCASHNGMALKEEFEYFAFRCCYCYTWNPARKQRPQAPRLERTSPTHTSGSDFNGDTSTEEEFSEEEPSTPREPKEGETEKQDGVELEGELTEPEQVNPIDDVTTTDDESAAAAAVKSPLLPPSPPPRPPPPPPQPVESSEPKDSKPSQHNTTDL